MFLLRRARPAGELGLRCFLSLGGVSGPGPTGMLAGPDGFWGGANFDFTLWLVLGDGSRFPGLEAEGVGFHQIYVDVFEARGFEARGKGVGIDHHHGVEDVEESEDLVVEAVGSGENAAGTKDACGFGEQTVLQRGCGHVVEHGEADCAIECSGGQRGCGRVFAQDGDVLSLDASTKRLCESLIFFHAGEARHAGEKNACYRAGTGSDFEDVGAERYTI